MCRTLLGTLALLCLAHAPAWGQAAQPAQPEGGNVAVWLLILLPLFGFVYLFFVASRTRKTYGVAVDRSLHIAEESLQAAKRQVDLQEETNRLLKQLIDERGRGDRG